MKLYSIKFILKTCVDNETFHVKVNEDKMREYFKTRDVFTLMNMSDVEIQRAYAMFDMDCDIHVQCENIHVSSSFTIDMKNITTLHDSIPLIMMRETFDNALSKLLLG